jgi:prolyl 4-hydroxylase
MDGFCSWAEKTIAAGEHLLVNGHRSGAAADSKTPKAVATIPPRPLPEIDTSSNVIRVQEREVQVRMVFKAPRIVLLANVLSDEECDALVEYAEPSLQRSSVLGDAQGNVQVHETRTSHSTGLRRAETDLITRIESRLAALTQWPVERGEGLHISRYIAGQEYRPHFDWINPDLPGLRRYLDIGGQRLASLILYLSKVEAGGGTAFPAIGLEVTPQKGGALFFLNTDSEYLPDQLTLHEGSPVIAGVKFVANKWLRQHEC